MDAGGWWVCSFFTYYFFVLDSCFLLSYTLLITYC